MRCGAFIDQAPGASGEIAFMTDIVEFRDGKIARETRCCAAPFEPPAWRAQVRAAMVAAYYRVERRLRHH